MTIGRDEYADMVTLLGPELVDPVDDTDWRLAAPVGFGDYLLLELMVHAARVAALEATVADLAGTGVGAFVMSEAATLVAPIGYGQWLMVNRATVAGQLGLVARIAPDQLTIIRTNERLALFVPRFDRVAAPTGDLVAYVRAKRLRVPLP